MVLLSPVATRLTQFHRSALLLSVVGLAVVALGLSRGPRGGDLVSVRDSPTRFEYGEGSPI